MLVVSIGRVHYFRADLAAVAGGVRKMFDLNVVLQGSETTAVLDKSTLITLVGSSPELRYSLPDHFAH